MLRRFTNRAVVVLTLLGSLALGGCIVVPYGYGPGYYHPRYWWR